MIYLLYMSEKIEQTRPKSDFLRPNVLYSN